MKTFIEQTLQDLSILSIQRLREEFWYWEKNIRISRDLPKENAENADKLYGEARRKLTEIAEELGERYKEDELYMEDDDGNYRPWHSYL